jgi:hypothetical protein
MSNAFGDELATVPAPANEFGDAPESPTTQAPSAPPLDPEKLFGGVDNLPKVLSPEAITQLNSALAGVEDKKTATKRAANIAFLSHNFGVDPERLATTADQYRAAYAKTVFHEDAPLDDNAFYDRVGQHIAQKKAEAGMLFQMSQGLFQHLRTQPNSGTIPALSQNFSQAFDSLANQAKNSPGWDPTQLDVYRQQMRQNWDEFQTQHTLLAEPIAETAKYLSFARNGVAPSEEAAAVAQREKVLKQLGTLTPDQAEMVMDFAAGQVGIKPKARGEDGFAEKAMFRLERGVGDFAANTIGAVRELARRGVALGLDRGEEAATIDRRDTQIERKLNQRITGEVDPLKGGGWIANSVLGTAESAPKLLAFMSGPGIFAAALATKEELRGHYEDQGMNPNQADLLSLVAAVPETALNFVSSKMIIGKLPGARQLLRGSLATRIATLATGEAVGLTAIAEIQQLLPSAVQSIASQLDSTIPGVDFGKELSDVVHATPETLGSMLPFILIGTGSASFRDRAYGQEYLKNRRAMEALGIKDKYIEQVADSATPEEAGAILRKGYADRVKEPTETKKEALVSMNLDSIQQREDMGQVYSQRYRDIMAKYPEDFHSLPAGHLPAELQRKDGTIVPVAFAGWGEGIDVAASKAAGQMVTYPIEGVAFKTDRGWSHGHPSKGDVLLTPVPSPEQWAAGVRDPDFVNIGARSADTSSGLGKETSTEAEMMKQWKAQIARDAEGKLTVSDSAGVAGQAATPEGAAGVLVDRTTQANENAVRSPTNQAERAPIIPELPKALLDLEARTDARLKELGYGGKLFSGLDPEMNYLLTVKGSLVIARGARDFAEFSAQMIRELGEKIRPHLEQLFTQSQDELQKHLELARANSEASISGPADPNAETKERTVTQRMSEGQGIAKGVAPEIRAALDNIQYPVRHMNDVQEAAAREISIAGEAAAYNRFIDLNNDLNPDTRVAIGKQLAEKFAAAGNWPAWHDTLMHAAEIGTSLGQGVNMFKIYGDQFTKPEQAEQLLFQEVQKKKTKIRKTEKTGEVAKVLKEEIGVDAEEKARIAKLKATMERLTELTNRGTIAQIANEVGPKAGEKVSEEIANLQKMIASARKGLREDLQNRLDQHEVKLRDLRARIEENTRLLNEGTQEEIKAHLGETNSPLVPADIKDLRAILADSRKALDAAVKEPTDFEGRVKARLKEMNVQTPKDIQKLYEKGLELFNEGKLTEKGLEEVLMQKHALPDIGGEHAKALSLFAERIASTPADSAARRDATIDLFDYVHNLLAPASRIDVGFALFYAHILAGYPTHIRNTLSNLTSLAEFGMDALFSKPSSWAAKWDGIINGAQSGAAAGIAEARQLMKTGRNSPLRESAPKFGQTSILEQTKFTGLARPYNLSKYVGRLLRASDVFFAATAYEIKARQVAWEMAQKAGGKDLAGVAERVDSLLNESPQQVADHEAQAREEFQMLHPDLRQGQTEAQWVDSRTRELRLLSRDQKLVDRASDLAARLTFNYKSEGMVGFFANSLISGFTSLRKAGEASQSPFLRFLTLAPRVEIPFIQIPANLFARAWEFGSGVSIVKALYGQELIYDGPGAAHFEAMSEDQRSMMLKRGIVGLASLATLAVAGYPTTGKDEEDRIWRIHGRGTGDPDKNRAFWGPEYRPYSIQFNVGGKSIFLPYKFLPIGPALAMVGAMHDGARYKQFDAKDGTFRLASAMKAIPQAMLSQTFMVQLSDSLDALMGTSRQSEDSTRKAIARFTVGTATSVAVPLANFWASIDRDFDPKQRDISTVKAALMSQVIGLRHLNRPALDILGDEMTNRPGGWFYTEASRNTPEARIYATFARLNLDPGDGSAYKQRLGDKFYDFFKVRQSYIKEKLLQDNGVFLDRLGSQTEERAKLLLAGIDEGATARALRAVGYRPPQPKR